MRSRALIVTFALASVGAGALATGGALGRGTASAPDRIRAANVVPPGESGMTNLTQFLAVTGGLSDSYGPHTDDQRRMYQTWNYKPMQFEGEGQGTPPPGDSNVTIWRDPNYGVPTITGQTDADLFYGVGYAMAQDRLFQMEVFRHVGHGTLAALIGPAGFAMDKQVRRFTEGDAALMDEFHSLPESVQYRAQRFTDGVNAYIQQANSNPDDLPAEFALLNDVPVKPWSVIDSLAFGEYAGRFFGEFGHGEMGALATYQHLLSKFSRSKAERIFEDLLPLNDPRAPTSIAPRDGRFPRTTSGHVPTTYHGSPYANHDPSVLPPPEATAKVAARSERDNALLARTQRMLALPRFGSNAATISGRLTRDGNAMLYGGPQTGWAVPGFFWEAELHSPVRDERGVMVPAIPVMVIGRNTDAAWTVTSALDANEDVFVDHLDPTNSTYLHDGQRLHVQKQTETIPCSNPPTDAVDLLGLHVPRLCPTQPKTIHLYRTIQGPAIAPPDANHDLFVRQSVVDGRLLSSLTAWDKAGRQTNVRRFGDRLRHMSLGFNFLYADDHGNIGYWHTGAYPIRPANADPTLPMPGTGAYDWRGLEPWSAHPHVINPSAGYVVNWNNKPAAGWFSKNLETGGEGGIWGDQWEVVPLARNLERDVPMTFHELGRLPRQVAYIDNPARVFMPYLLAALRHTHDSQLVAMRGYLRNWNELRNDVDKHTGHYTTPAVVFFDRFFEDLMQRAEEPELGSAWAENAGLDCETCHLRSVDNLAAPTYKFEYAGEQVLLAALRGQTRFAWHTDHRRRLFLGAAKSAAAELTREQGPDPSKWNEVVEIGRFGAQGAISAHPLIPLPNRGSYGQVVEAGR